MAEQLLSQKETARRLGISVRHFHRIRGKLQARGLQPIQVGHFKKYREATLDKLIRRAGETGNPLATLPSKSSQSTVLNEAKCSGNSKRLPRLKIS